MTEAAETMQERKESEEAQSRTGTQGGTTTAEHGDGHRREHGDGMRVHTIHADLPIPYFTPGDITANARAAGSRLPKLPSAKDIAFYGGLGAMALAGALEWPVALAIGAATAVVRGSREERREERHEERREGAEAGQPIVQTSGEADRPS